MLIDPDVTVLLSRLFQLLDDNSLWEKVVWEIDLYQNEWPWPSFRGRITSRQPLRYIWRWISRKPL